MYVSRIEKIMQMLTSNKDEPAANEDIEVRHNFTLLITIFINWMLIVALILQKANQCICFAETEEQVLG